MLTLDQQAQERALLAAILAEPGDDAHRLIYADWLEETGQEARAEFVRVQIALARIRTGSPAWVTLVNRQMMAWLNLPSPCMSDIPLPRDGGFHCKMPGGADAEAPCVRFERGFVVRVRCPLAAWEKHGPGLVARHPVERVGVTDDLIVPLPTQAWPDNCRIRVAWLPAWLRKQFYGRGQRAGTPSWVYDTEADARDALSRELLAWAAARAEEEGLLP